MLSICSTKVGTLPSCAASTTSDPKFEDSTTVLLLNFCSILQQKLGPIGVPKICLVDFLMEFTRTYKKHKIW